jgi:hypothetical protein
MSPRFARMVAVLTLTLFASGAQAEHIYKWVDHDGVLHVTNVSRDAKGHRGKVKADPAFKYLVPGPTAPLDFTPNDQTAKYDAYIKEACAKYHIPPALVRAIMDAESNFDPRAMSEKGALGLMQLMPQTGDKMFVSDILDPRENIMGGVRYLRVLANRFDGDMVKIVAAYNAGPNAVIAAGGVPQIPETQDYVRKVLKRYYQYKGEPAGASSDSETAWAH